MLSIRVRLEGISPNADSTFDLNLGKLDRKGEAVESQFRLTLDDTLLPKVTQWFKQSALLCFFDVPGTQVEGDLLLIQGAKVMGLCVELRPTYTLENGRAVEGDLECEAAIAIKAKGAEFGMTASLDAAREGARLLFEVVPCDLVLRKL